MLHEILQLLKKDNLMVQALDECHEMLELCRSMVRASAASLRDHDDAEIDLDLFKLDKTLNAFERDVRRKVMTHLSVGGHGADITSGLVLVSIVIDIERIGDYSKNIYDLARDHPQRLHAGPLEERLAATETLAWDNFERCIDAFKSADANEALALMKDYKEDITVNCREMEEQLIKGAVDLGAADAVTVALYLRFIKRISSHARNLVSSVSNPFPRIGYRSK